MPPCRAWSSSCVVLLVVRTAHTLTSTAAHHSFAANTYRAPRTTKHVAPLPPRPLFVGCETRAWPRFPARDGNARGWLRAGFFPLFRATDCCFQGAAVTTNDQWCMRSAMPFTHKPCRVQRMIPSIINRGPSAQIIQDALAASASEHMRSCLLALIDLSVVPSHSLPPDLHSGCLNFRTAKHLPPATLIPKPNP